MARTMENLKRITTQVSLPDYMKNQLNFEEAVDHQENINLEKPAFYDRNGETLTVGKNQNNEWYYQRPESYEYETDEPEKFSIIDLYLEEHPNATFEKAVQDLNEALNQKTITQTNESEYNVQKPRQYTFDDHYNSLKPLQNRLYFYQNGITDKTIDHPLFKNMIRQKERFSPNKNRTYSNVAFLMKDRNNKISAISTRSNNVKGAYGDRKNSMAISDRLHSKENVDQIHISERMIDNMSHFQINKNKLSDKEILYMATQGDITGKYKDNTPRITEEQANIVNQHIEKNPDIEKLNIGFDNDLSGNYYATKLLSELNPDLPENSKAKENLVQSGHNASVHINRANNGKKYGIVSFKPQNESGMNNLYKDISQNSENYGANHFRINYNKENNSIDISFEHNNNNWFKAFHVTNRVKFDKNNLIYRDKPLSISYNDDLKASKLKHPLYIIAQNQNPNSNSKVRAYTYHSFLTNLGQNNKEQLKQITGHQGEVAESPHVKKENDNTFTIDMDNNGSKYNISRDQINQSILDNEQSIFTSKSKEQNQEQEMEANTDFDKEQEEDKSHVIDNDQSKPASNEKDKAKTNDLEA
jgi:hypothetical protein